LVGRGLCMTVWGGWVGVGQWWFVRVGLELVGWGWSVGVCAGGFGVGGLRWSVVGCAFGFGVGELGLVGRGLGWKVWGWWVGVGQW